MAPRARKGTVSIAPRNGMLRLRFSHGGERYEFSPGLPDSPLARHRAKKIASTIELDIAAGHFDATLEKYRERVAASDAEAATDPGRSTVDLFSEFIDTRRRAGSGEYNLHNVYGTLHRYLDRFGRPIAGPDDAAELLERIKAGQLQVKGKGCGDRTLNKYLSIYRRFSAWAVANDHWSSDHFRRLEATRTERSRASRKAFSDLERRAILDTMAAHAAYRHYLGYTRALFWLGWRPSELIGLRWAHINIESREVTVGESLSRDVVGRSRKPTKGQTVRTLSLNQGQWEIIGAQLGQALPQLQELVFPSPEGKPIDDHNFCRRVWLDVLADAGVSYRPPYTARHTFATWAKRNGMTDEALAYWMGHKTTRMIREHYGHLDESAIVPDLPPE